MSIPKLTPRLEAVASFVRSGGVVADIGTDHALLPVCLVNSGRIKRAFACDLREGPLARARATVEACGAQGGVELLRCDGLDGVGFADDVVIAGMGGTLIAEILGRCGFIRDPRVALVLQPMTAAPALRGFLCRLGFELKREAVAAEGRQLYVVMSAAFTGRAFEPDEFFCLTGLLPQAAGGPARAYLLRVAEKLGKKARGLESSRGRSAEAAAVAAMAERIAAAAQTNGGMT